MPILKRIKTRYPGVYYIQRKTTGSGRRERTYYMVYRKDGRQIEEKAGRQFQDSMTPGRAARIRAECIEGKRMPHRKKMNQKDKTVKAQGRPEAEKLEQEPVDNKLFEKRWVAFTKSAIESFSIFDSELNLVAANDATLKLYPPGTRKEDLMGKNVVEIVPELKGGEEKKRLFEVVKTGVPVVLDDIVSPSMFGARRWNTKVFKVGDEVGIIALDITDRKRKEEELRKREAELEANRRKK